MFNILKKRTLLFITTGVMLIVLPLSAQLKREGLIFSEVYLNENGPDKSWIEIYNPTDKPLVLEKFRFYNIMTTNILPEEIRKKGGIELVPGETLILCADKTKLNFSNNVKIVQIEVISAFGKGGFFSINTKGMEENGVDIFRYGDPEKTSELSNQISNFVVPFSTDDKSYSRVNDQYKFTKSEPSPGVHVGKGGKQ